MKSNLLGLGIVATLIFTTPQASLAEDNVAAINKTSTRQIINITPINLVESGYQGRFTDLGIPSHGVFSTAIKTNRVNSQLLVKSAIESGRLDPEMMNDRSYLNQVQSLLNLIDKD